MPGPDELEAMERFGRDVLAPRVCRPLEPIDAEVWQTTGRVPFEVAREQAWEPVGPGWDWGPAFSTAWFRLRTRLPAAPPGLETVLRFSTATEGLLWWNGRPVQGFDPGRDRWHVPTALEPGSPIELFVEAACNHLWGDQAFSWDDEATHRRWASRTPGRFERCEWAGFDPQAFEAWAAWDFAVGVVREAPAGDAERAALLERLHRAMEGVDPERPGDLLTALGGENAVARGLASVPPGYCVGHAHIDTAWLWPVAETIRKCARSWTNVLRLMERQPDFAFVASQPQQYRWAEQEYPDVFEEIRRRVEDGRWEPEGAMWVEADCNCPSGESLARQILHGTRYFEDRFGPRGRQRVLFLPDTFGFPPCLPQLMALSGLELFVTNKLHWNDTNEFPHTTFLWRGLDGTERLAHCTPGRDYNSELTPKELTRAVRTNREGHSWLQPFGIGDGGGGPRAEHFERIRLSSRFKLTPPLRPSTIRTFLDRLQADTDGGGLPVWEGELYLEKHRGTYTTHGRSKQANLDCEELLRTAEALSVFDPAGTPQSREIDHDRLNEAWKLVLLNQFHDILPGSSIRAVYEDAHRDSDRAKSLARDVVLQRSPSGARPKRSEEHDEPVVFNPASSTRSQVVEHRGESVYIQRLEPFGLRALPDGSASVPETPVLARERSLANGRLSVRIDDLGRLEVEALASGASPLRGLNQLVLYDDRPPEWDAWDIDPDYEKHAAPVETPPGAIRIVQDDGLRGAIEISRPLGERSRIRQRYVLDAGSPRLDIRTWVDWREEHKLLRALFPTGLIARHTTCGTQFGHVSRPAHQDTSFERARFEFPAHRWVDLSDSGRGLAVLAAAKHGFSCRDGTIGLSLLRAPTHPDPQADRGEHEFVYSVMPHGGDWRAAKVDAEAEALTRPLHVLPRPSDSSGEWTPFRLKVDGGARVEIACCKRAEDADDIILRLVETRGEPGEVLLSWPSSAVSAVDRVDLLERAPVPITMRSDATRVSMRSFEIVTLRARRTS